MTATITMNGETHNFTLTEKTFSTGSKGYHGNGKIVITEDEKYQVNLLIIRIRSKPKKPEVPSP